MVIKFFSLIILIIFSGLASAVDFDFNYSSHNEKDYIVEIYSNAKENYDVKIFIHNSQDSKISQSEVISQIKKEESWQSSWNYIISSFPEKREYFLRITDSSSEELSICLRLRKTGVSSFDELCKSLNVQPKSSAVSEYFNDSEILLKYEPNEKSISKVSEVTTSEEVFRIYLLYFFCAFCIVIIFFLSLRNL